MRTGAPLCARGRVRALRGLPRAASGAPSSLSGVRPPAPEGRLAAGRGADSGQAQGPGDGGLRVPARRWPLGDQVLAAPGRATRARPLLPRRPSAAPSIPPGESGLEPDRPLDSGRGPGASPGPGILDHVVQFTAGLAGGTSSR